MELSGTVTVGVRYPRMELLQNRKAWSVTGVALSFSLLVAWMMPPTDPRPAASNWRTSIRPAAPPAPVDFPGYAYAMTSMPAYPVERTVYAGGETGTAEDVVVYRQHPDGDAEPAVALPADRTDTAAMSGVRTAENGDFVDPRGGDAVSVGEQGTSGDDEPTDE